MSLQQILEFRRAVRYYKDENIDSEKVKHCLQLAQLTPSSSNMQLYEVFHVTDEKKLKQLSDACLGQLAASTAKEMVVFVTRQDYYKRRAKEVLSFEKENIRKYSPKDRYEKRYKRIWTYYSKIMPFLYSRMFGMIGFLRKALVQVVGLSRPIVRQVSEADVRVTVHQSCGMVAQTFMMAMSEQGYDTCPIGGFDSWRVKKILGLPYKAEIGMIVSCGIRDEKGVWGDRFRVPFDEIYTRK